MGDDRAHELHNKNCSCISNNFIDHRGGCTVYRNFFNELVEIFGPESIHESNLEVVTNKNRDNPFFLKQPT